MWGRNILSITGSVCSEVRKLPTHEFGSVFVAIFADPATNGRVRMSDISTLQEKINLRTFSFILLNSVTFGLYSNIWLYKTSNAVEEVTHVKVMSPTFLIGYLALVGVGGILINVAGKFAPVVLLIWNALVWLVAALWCFRVRNALRRYTLTEHNFAPRINRVVSVLFTFYHVNYCINSLAREKQKHREKNN